MSEQLRNLLAALFCLLLLVMLVAPQPQVQPDSVPNTEDKKSRGFYVLSAWLERSGYSVVSHRYRYDALIHRDQESMLVVQLPTTETIQDREMEALADWLAQGNQLTLVVESSFFISDAPLRSFLFGLGIDLGFRSSDEAEDDSGQLDEQVGEEVDEGLPDMADIEEAFDYSPIEYRSAFDHPLFDGVPTYRLFKALELSVDQFDADVEATALYVNPDSGDGVAWLLRTERYPNGIFILGHEQFLNNEGLRTRRSQQFVRNLMENFVSRTEVVVFDDFHHGLSELYDVNALLADSRFQWSVFAMLLLWLIYIALYNLRLGPVVEPSVRLSNREFSMAAGNLYARHTEDSEVNQQLIKAFNNKYRLKHRLPRTGESVCGHMQTNPIFQRVDALNLNRLEQNTSMDPMKTQGVLFSLYRRLESV